MLNKLSLKMSESTVSCFRPGMMKWHYQDGLVVRAVYEAGKFYGRKDFVAWAVSMYDSLIEEDGTIKTYRQSEYNLDQINPGRLLFELYSETGDGKYLKAINTLDNQLKNHPRTTNGLFWHKEIYPWQVWLDGLYMQGPFSVKAGHFEQFADQLIKVYGIFRDSGTGLLYHAWDESRGMKWSDDRTGLSPNFWSRSIGWYLMACTDCLSLAPEGSEDKKDELRRIVNDLLKAVYSFQSAEGMWYQVTDRPADKGNYLETSGSSMFCYGALRAAMLGFDSSYVAAAVKGIEGICSEYLYEKDSTLHLGGICSVAGLGGNPYRDGSCEYYYSEPVVEDDFKGTGPFILACLEYEKLIGSRKQEMQK